MKFRTWLLISLVIAVLPSVSSAQRQKSSDEDFVKEKPAVGEQFPDLVVYSVDGKEVPTSSLRGHYSVVTFGCLT